MLKNTYSFSAFIIEALHNSMTLIHYRFACELGIFDTIFFKITTNYDQHPHPLRYHDDFVVSIEEHILDDFQKFLALECKQEC